jgi:hypothetical protein
MEACRHQLKRPPDIVTDLEGISYMLFRRRIGFGHHSSSFRLRRTGTGL